MIDDWVKPGAMNNWVSGGVLVPDERVVHRVDRIVEVTSADQGGDVDVRQMRPQREVLLKLLRAPCLGVEPDGIAPVVTMQIVPLPGLITLLGPRPWKTELSEAFPLLLNPMIGASTVSVVIRDLIVEHHPPGDPRAKRHTGEMNPVQG